MASLYRDDAAEAGVSVAGALVCAAKEEREDKALFNCEDAVESAFAKYMVAVAKDSPYWFVGVPRIPSLALEYKLS